MIFESSEKVLSKPPNLNKQHKFTNYLGLNFLMKKVHSIPHQDIYHFRMGASLVLLFSSGLAYYFYRRDKLSEFSTGEGVAKLMNSKPFNAGALFYEPLVNNKTTISRSQFTRIPEFEFNVYYKLRKCFISGYFDHTKEILIPKTKQGTKGYDVITPFYYYNQLSPDPFFSMNVNGKAEPQMRSLRGAIAVNRGW